MSQSGVLASRIQALRRSWERQVRVPARDTSEGWITPTFRTLFWLLTLPSTLLLAPREQYADAHNRDAFTHRRAMVIDTYVAAWFLFASLTFVFFWHSWIAVALCVYRVIDIFATCTRTLLFDRTKSPEGKWQIVVVSPTRMIVLGIANYFEVWVLFAVYYRATRALGESARDAWDYLYFSGATQLTIGYGDLVPVGTARFAGLMQGFIGLIVFWLFIAVFLSGIGSIIKKHDKTV